MKRYASWQEWVADHKHGRPGELWAAAIAEGEARAEDRRPRLTLEQVEALRSLAFEGAGQCDMHPEERAVIRLALAALGEG